MNGRYHYVPKNERRILYGTLYEAYAVMMKEGDTMRVIMSDVARSKAEILQLCNLLNENDLEPEQARYVIEDFVAEQYLV